MISQKNIGKILVDQVFGLEQEITKEILSGPKPEHWQGQLAKSQLPNGTSKR